MEEAGAATATLGFAILHVDVLVKQTAKLACDLYDTVLGVEYRHTKSFALQREPTADGQKIHAAVVKADDLAHPSDRDRTAVL
jgi:hypothetical protein